MLALLKLFLISFHSFWAPSFIFHFWGNFLFGSFSALCWARYNPKFFVACRFVLLVFGTSLLVLLKLVSKVTVKNASLSLDYFAAGFFNDFPKNQFFSENKKTDNVERNLVFIGSHYVINHSIYNTNSVLIILILCKKFFVLLLLSKSSVSQLKSFQVFINFFGLLFRTFPAMFFFVKQKFVSVYISSQLVQRFAWNLFLSPG